MPTYEYVCNTCGNRFEKFQKFTEDPIKACPECGQAVRKVFHASGVVFKGSGWYINDSRSSGDKKASDSSSSSNSSNASSESKAETTSEAKSESSEGKADSKAETKTETKPEAKSGSKEAAA